MWSDSLWWREGAWNYPAELLQCLKHLIVLVTVMINQKSTTSSILGKSQRKLCHACRLPSKFEFIEIN